jgi:hypothetical protein
MYNVQIHGVLHNNVVRRATLHATLFAGLHYMRRCSQDYITCDVVRRATLHARVGILLICGKHLHDHIIWLRGEFLVLNLLSKPGNWVIMCLFIKGIDYSSFYYFDIWFWNSSDSELFYVFPLISNYFIDSVDWYTFSLKWFVIWHTMVFLLLAWASVLTLHGVPLMCVLRVLQ